MKKFLPVLAVAALAFAALPCYAQCGCGAAPACGCEATCDTGCHGNFFGKFRGWFHRHDCCESQCAAPTCGCQAAPACGCDTCHHHSFRLFSRCHHNACDCAPAAPTCCAAPAPACGCGAPACDTGCHRSFFGGFRGLFHHHNDCGCGAPAPTWGCGCN